MDSWAFQNDKKLKTVKIANGAQVIGSSAFADDTSLTSANIPASVLSIGGFAFKNCSSLKDINIPDSVTEIGYEAFNNCSSAASLKIGNSVTEIDGSAFYNCDSLTEVTIPDSVQTLGSSVFASCDNLTTVNIGAGVKNMDSWAFEGNKKLKTVKIAYGAQVIGYSAFNNCTSLQEITIPASVTKIGSAEQGGADLIDSYVFRDHPTGMTICGKKGSFAEAFANANGIQFKELKASVSGNVKSYINSDSAVTLELSKNGSSAGKATVFGNSSKYSFDSVEPGVYTLTVSKDNHITREYTVTVADADVTQDVKICPKGDVNGDGETDIMDCSLAQRYIRELTTLDAYQIACGDVSGTGDGELDIQDVSRILRHIRELAMLY